MGVKRRNVDGLAAPPGYSHVAVAGGLVFTAGAVPLDPGGNLVGVDDPAAQAIFQPLIEKASLALAIDEAWAMMAALVLIGPALVLAFSARPRRAAIRSPT